MWEDLIVILVGFWYNIGNSNQIHMDTEQKKTDNALPEPIQVADSKVIPTKLKDKFATYKHEENEKIIDSVSSKIEETIGDDGIKASGKKKKASGGPLTPFEQFLNDTNLTFRQFVMFLAFIVLIIAVIGFSIYLLFSFLGSEPKEVDITETVVVEEVKVAENKVSLLSGLKNRFFPEKVDVKEDVKEPTKEVVKEDPPKEVVKTPVEPPKQEVFVPAQIGKTTVSKFATNSLKTANKIGFGEITENNLSYFVRTYRKIRNIYNTDLFAYLAVIPDRKQGYDQFLIQFKGAFEELKIANEQLNQEIAVLNLRLDELQVRTSELENKFFTDLDELESENLPETLLAFQEISQKRTIVLSELKARESVVIKYKKAIPLIEEKIAAITVNEDPFVKGVKVVDFGGVDLDLIVAGQ